MKLLLFAGTTEGRVLAQRLAHLPLEASLCVATEYGKEVLDALPERFEILTGRMDTEQMESLMRDGYTLVVDATHPYALLVSKNIAQAADCAGLPYLRLLREESNPQVQEKKSCIYLPTLEDCVEQLKGTEGNILLTTGSKDLAKFTSLPGYAERIYPRVLPTEESIQACTKAGFTGKHIIAMQGPFSLEMNLALMHQFAIQVMVTKDGGKAGGFTEKIEAAEKAGIQTIVIGRAPEQGLGMDEVVEYIESRI